MGTGKGGASDGVGKGFRLGFVSRRGGKRSTGFSRGASSGEKVNFVADGAAEVDKGFPNVRRVVVGFVCILRAGWGVCQG